jgi:C4-type Zn-finger protein
MLSDFHHVPQLWYVFVSHTAFVVRTGDPMICPICEKAEVETIRQKFDEPFNGLWLDEVFVDAYFCRDCQFGFLDDKLVDKNMSIIRTAYELKKNHKAL